MRLIEIRPTVKCPAGFLAAALFIALLSSGAAAAATPGAYVMESSTISISDVTQSEGNTNFDFTVTLSKAVGTAVTVDFRTADGFATATPPNNDYVSELGTLTIPPNALSATITIEVVDDAVHEDDETFFVRLSNPSAGQTIDDAEGLGTILDNDLDDDPTIRIDNVAKLEGDTGTTDFVFTVQLSGPLGQDVTVDFATSDGTATIANSDYIASSGTLTILAGTTSATLTILVNGDTNGEASEIFYVTLSNPSLGTIADAVGEGAIINDDPGGPTGVDNTLVTEFALGNVWPNPARGIASINYALPQQTRVRLTVFDLQGREVAVLVNDIRAAGRYTAEWTGRGNSYGTYFYRLQAGSFVQTRKFTFLKEALMHH